MDGDLDCLIVIGIVYNGVNSFLYLLFVNKIWILFKSMSILGGDGFNELCIEDK